MALAQSETNCPLTLLDISCKLVTIADYIENTSPKTQGIL